MNKPKIVCLCGSTRFKEAFIEAVKTESLAGNIVLTVCWFTHVDGSLGEAEEEIFRGLHFHKIDLADEIFVLNMGGYVGESTVQEINYAIGKGKPIRYLEGEIKARWSVSSGSKMPVLSLNG